MSITCPKCQTDNPDTSHFCADCGARLFPRDDFSVAQTETLEAPKKELTTGSAFTGRYQIIEELGEDGMDKIYKVLEKEVNSRIALKLIKPEIASMIERKMGITWGGLSSIGR